MNIFKFAPIALSITFLGSALAAGSADLDWEKIPGNTLALFYPGQST